jgi:hypothetical protein
LVVAAGDDGGAVGRECGGSDCGVMTRYGAAAGLRREVVKQQFFIDTYRERLAVWRESQR